MSTGMDAFAQVSRTSKVLLVGCCKFLPNEMNHLISEIIFACQLNCSDFLVAALVCICINFFILLLTGRMMGVDYTLMLSVENFTIHAKALLRVPPRNIYGVAISFIENPEIEYRTTSTVGISY